MIMDMRTIPAGEFKQHCLRLLDEVGESGESLVITKRGRPVAEIVPVRSSYRDWAGSMRDQITFIGDIVSPAVDPEEWEVLRD